MVKGLNKIRSEGISALLENKLSGGMVLEKEMYRLVFVSWNVNNPYKPQNPKIIWDMNLYHCLKLPCHKK